MIPPDALPDGWRWVRFGDVVRQVKDRVDPETAGIKRYVAGEHMNTDDLRIHRWGMVGDGYLGPAFHMRFRPGHVLYGSRRTYLRKVAFADFEGICANTTFVLEPATEDLLREFLPLVMTSEEFHAHSIGQSKGSVNPYINFRDLTWYEFALPPCPVQAQMVEDLRAFDATLKGYDELVSALRTLRQSAFVAAQGGGMEVQLGDVIQSIEAGKSPPAADRLPNEGEKGVLKVSAVRDGWFDAGEVKTVLGDRDLPSSTILRDGDVLVSRANTSERVGWACIVDNAPARTYLCDKTLRLQPDPAVVDPLILVALLGFEPARRQIEGHATGSSASMKNISQKKLLSIKLTIPPLSEQQRLVELETHLVATRRRACLAAQALRTARARMVNRLAHREVRDV